MHIVTYSVPDPWRFGTDPDPSYPHLWLTDLNLDPALFGSDLLDADKKIFLLITLPGTSLFTDKSHKKVTEQ
jgi:hypothetical protein